MVKKLLTILLGLSLAVGLEAQTGNYPFPVSNVLYWVGSGTNSAVVNIGLDNTGLIYGVHWNGSLNVDDIMDTLNTYDDRLTIQGIADCYINTMSYYDESTGDSYSDDGYGWMYRINGGSAGAICSQSIADGDYVFFSNDYAFNTTNYVFVTDPNAAFSCLRVQGVGVTGLTATTAMVNITDTSNVNNYTVMLYAGDSLVDSTVVYTQTRSYTTLTANTGYTLKVFSNCSDGTQTPSRNASFRTPCVTIAHNELPWTEDFQSGTGSSYSTAAAFFSNHVFCWDLINPYSTSDPYINSSSSVNPAGGQCLYVSSRNSSPTILVLPPFEDAPNLLQLSFDVKSTYGHGFEAGVITDVTDASTFTPVASCLPSGSDWNHFEVTFAGITEGRLALRRNDESYGYLDNVTVRELPSCVKPSQVLVSDITASSADIAVTDPNFANHYMIYYTAEDSVEVYSDGTTISGLLPNTRYVVRVKTLCNDTTTGYTETAFRTACGPQAIPYYEDFSQFADVSNGYGYAVTDSTLPCWKFYNARAQDRLELIPYTNTYGYGENGLTLRIYGNYSNSIDLLVLPEFDQEANALEVSFMARPSETGSFGGTLQLGYVTDADDSSTFVAVASYPCAQFTSGYGLCASVFPAAPAGSRIAIRYLPSGGSAKSWYIDDLDVHEMPACVRAQGISVDSITTESFTLHVIDPMNEGSYRCYYSANGVTDSVDFYNTEWVIDGLDASTDYTISVVTICGDGSLTLPHTTTVSTLCAPIETLPFVENFDDWTATQSDGMNRCWNRLYRNSSSSLVTNNYPYCASGSGNAYTGFKSLKIYSKGTSSGIKEYSVAYLPEMAANMNTLKVNFFYKYSGSTTNMNKVKIAVGVSESVADTSTFTRLATLTPTEIGWNEFEVDLSGYTGTGNRITIMQTSTGTTGITSYIDSLVVDTLSSCNRPTTLEASNITAYGATLTWTDPTDAGSYILRWSDGTTADSATVTGETSYALTGLTPSTNYTVDVRSLCWGEPTAARSTTFATGCAALPLPWNMNFDNITNINQLSSCWSRYSGIYVDSTNSATLTSTTSGWTRSTTAFDESSHVKVNLYSTTCKYWLVTPEIDLDADAELSFDYMLTAYNNSNAPQTGTGLEDDRFVVLATTDSGTTWMPVAQWGSDAERDDYALADVTNSVSHATLSLAAYTGQIVRLAFYAESTVGGTDNDFRIDNIVVDATGTTPEPPAPIDSCATAQALPYNQDFSGYVDNQAIRPYMAGAAMPECWTAIGNGTTQYYYTPNSETATYFGGVGYSTSTNSFGAIAAYDAFLSLIGSQIYTGDNASHTASMSTTGTQRYAMLPLFEQPLAQTVLTFDHRTSGTGARLVVGYVLTDTASFVGIDTMTADNRVLHHDTVRFAEYASMPDSARLTFKWEVTSSTNSTTGPGYRYCGIDNLVVAIDTTPVTPEPPAPVDSLTNADILFWVGHGSDSAIVIINWVDELGIPTTYAWGLAFDDDYGVVVSEVFDSIAAYDPRFSHSFARYMYTIQYLSMVSFVDDNDSLYTITAGMNEYNCVKLDGVDIEGSDFEDEWINPGSLIEVSTDCYFNYGTVIPVTPPANAPEPPVAVDATIAASDILFWVGEGNNSVVMAVNWADTALAWGYRFSTDSVSTATMMSDIAAADLRFSFNDLSFISDINYIDTAAGIIDTLGITIGNYWSSLLNGQSDNGMGQMLGNGDFKKWGDPAAGVAIDSVAYGQYIFYTYVFPMTIHPVTVPDTTVTIDTIPVVPEHGPFCGAAGTEGSTAIAADSSAFVAWATGVVLTRGPWSIANPDGPLASFGGDTNAIGMATMNNTMDAVSLGDGGSALVTFAHPIRNGEGPDFAVFENGFDDGSLELAYVEVSSDGVRFVRFPATCLTQTETQLANAGQSDPTNLNNLAGKYRIGYGTPFDLEELSDSTGINIDSIVYVRVVDVVGSIDPQYGTYDGYGHIVNDPWPTYFASSGFDLTGVGVIYELIDSTVVEDSCIAPTNLVVDSITTHSALLSWTAGGTESAWVVNCNGTDIDVTTNPFALTSLTPNTTYTVKVKAVCGEGNESDWSDTLSFTTLDTTPAIVYYTITLTANNPDWGTVYGADTYAEGTEVVIRAEAKAGYHFVSWSDSIADSVRTLVVTSDINLVAIFAENVGIEDVVAVVEGLWPNPTTDYVTVRVCRPVEAQLYDLTGRRVAVYNFTEGNNTLDFTSLNVGVYMLHVEGSVSKIVKK